MRNISLKLLTQRNIEIVSTDATTFGGLKAAIGRNTNLNGKIAFGDVQFIERNSKAVFGDIEDATLPEGDLIMFVVPKKTKSGMDCPDFDNMTKLELVKFADNLNNNYGADIDTTETFEYIQEQIEEFIDDYVEPSDTQEKLYSIADTLRDLAVQVEGIADKFPEQRELGGIQDILQQEAEAIAKLV